MPLTDQSGRGEFDGAGHNIQHPVHPVDEIHIENSRATEHRFRSLSPPAICGMRGEILRTDVSLNVSDDASLSLTPFSPTKPAADEIVSDVAGKIDQRKMGGGG